LQRLLRANGRAADRTKAARTNQSAGRTIMNTSSTTPELNLHRGLFTTLARFVRGGVVPTTVNAVICEIHRTWNRPEAAEIAQVAPNYRAVVESYQRAQPAAKTRA
jgi:hypothetical protein